MTKNSKNLASFTKKMLKFAINETNPGQKKIATYYQILTEVF